MTKNWVFLTDCIGSNDGPGIQAMVDGATDLTYATVRKHLGDALVELERALGYDVGHERGGLRMRKDWAVSYARSQYQGRECIYVRWSAIEHIFVQEG